MEILKSITIAIGLISAGAGGSWYIKEEQITNLIEKNKELEKINKLNYPSFLSKINIATKELNSHLNTLEDINILKQDKKILKEHNENIKNKLSIIINQNKEQILKKNKLLSKLKSDFKNKSKNLKNKIVSLNNEINQLKAKTTYFKLLKGNGITLKKGQINIGYSNNDTTNYQCRITMNNKAYTLEAGSFIPFKTNKINCNVVLTKCPIFSSENAEFKLVCQ